MNSLASFAKRQKAVKKRYITTFILKHTLKRTSYDKVQSKLTLKRTSYTKKAVKKRYITTFILKHTLKRTSHDKVQSRLGILTPFY